MEGRRCGGAAVLPGALRWMVSKALQTRCENRSPAWSVPGDSDVCRSRAAGLQEGGGMTARLLDVPAAAGSFARDHVIRELPVLVILPHSRCNCRCVMCDIWQIRQIR